MTLSEQGAGICWGKGGIICRAGGGGVTRPPGRRRGLQAA